MLVSPEWPLGGAGEDLGSQPWWGSGTSRPRHEQSSVAGPLAPVSRAHPVGRRLLPEGPRVCLPASAGTLGAALCGFGQAPGWQAKPCLLLLKDPRTGQQEPKNSLARRASQAPGPASRGPGSPVAATSGPASCGQRHRPARHGHPCPAASLACRPAVPGPSSLPQLCLVEPHLLLRLGLCHASRDPLRPGDAPSSSPPRLTSRPPESPQHLGCPHSGALGCWS